MSRNGKVVVAMSGGVDSSVAACLLRDQGHECVGVFMRVGAAAAHAPAEAECRLGDAGAARRRLRHGCCSASDAQDARAVADRLGIPFYALNFEADFAQIVDYFVDEYGRGRTPNPCVMCNIHLKFGRLLRYADMLDAEFVATGHYARTVLHNAGDGAAQTRLARAANSAKDQSYVLFGIPRDSLSRCLFPLGEIADKAQVRALAAELGLRVHDKPDSQEICFVPDNDYRRLIAQRRPELLAPGVMQTTDGRDVGPHDGVASYTIGQRHGLGVALGKPMYVVRLNVVENRVTIGPREALDARGLIASDVNWLVDPPSVDAPFRGAARIRHMHAPATCVATRRGDGTLEVAFDEPQPAVTPGQAAVLYAEEIVMGGGWIRESFSAGSG